MKMTPIALGCVMLTSASLTLVNTASAIPIAETQVERENVSGKGNDKGTDVWNDDGTVAVVVADGETLTYTLNGETVSVAGGESVLIPAGAKNVFFPVGSTVTVKRAAVGKPYTYTVGRNVTLGSISKSDFRTHTTAFVPNHTPGVKNQSGSKIHTVFVNPTTIGGKPGTDKN